MSLYPCDIHGTRVRGPLESAYISILFGTDRFSRKMRVCSHCLARLLSERGARWIDITEEFSDDEAQVCASCQDEAQGVRGGGCSLFATIYAHGQERMDFFARYHPECGKSLIDDLGLTLA